MTVVASLAVAALVGIIGYAILAHIRDSDASWLHDRQRRNRNWMWE